MNRRVDAPAAGQRFVVARPSLRALADQHLYSALSSLGRLWQRRGGSARRQAANQRGNVRK